MKIHTGIGSIIPMNHPVVTIGTFDGVHEGHQKILRDLVAKAKETGGESVVFTFYPHPRKVLFPHDGSVKMLTTQKEKFSLLEKCGIDHLIVYPFTKEFSRLTSVDFVRDILVNKAGMKELVIGYDHHFGRNREGNIQNLRELAPIYDFKVSEIKAELVDEVAVSSTKIRKALTEGNIQVANRYLGYQYEFTATVVDGNKLGKSTGFPTANLQLEDMDKLLPANGVYAVIALHHEKQYGGMMNIGTRPTVQLHGQLTVEVNLFDFKSEIYGHQLTIRPLKRLRDEKKFSGVEELIRQLHEDKKNAVLQLKQIKNVTISS